MKNLTKKVSLVTMVLLLFTALNMCFASAAEKISYTKFTGTIIDIKEGPSKLIYVQSKDGPKNEFAINPSTYVDKLAKIEIGSTVTCFYDANDNTPLPYWRAAIAITDTPGVFLSKFDDNLLNAEKDLKITPDKNTEITLRNGDKYTGDITNKTLLVFSLIVAQSYPAQTTPTRIVVMDYIPITPHDKRILIFTIKKIHEKVIIG